MTPGRPTSTSSGSHYLLYFTAALKSPTAHVECIGAAISTRVDGPYLAATGSPFICQLADGGSIEPRTFVDADGTPYMIWKSDQNSDTNGSERTSIYSQRLSADGEHLLGQPTRIFGPDEAWQGRIVEAPDLVLVRGQYDLFYSGSWFNQPGYAIGVAGCAGPLGRACAATFYLTPLPLLGHSNARRGRGRARSRSSPTSGGTGCSTRRSARPSRSRDRPGRWRWCGWASVWPVPTWPLAGLNTAG